MKKAELTEKAKKVKKTKVKKDKTVADKEVSKDNAKTSRINDGKCCRCVYHKDRMCVSTKSEKKGSYTPRKFSCACFKYAE